MKKLIHPFILLLLFSCQNDHSDSPTVEAGNWGHLQGLSSTLPSKLYLSDVKKEDIYQVCLPRYFSEKYKGIETEIKASINIWGHYIGRKIKVSLLTIDLPEPLENQKESEVMEDYYKSCPSGTDVVVGEAFFSDGAIGKTIPTFSYHIENGKKKVVNFKRAVFLKKSPENSSGENSYQWKTLTDKTGQNYETSELLELLTKRNLKIALEEDNELLTLRTMIHEFGHVWGLCDQYELGNHSTNCDPSFATINHEGHVILEDDSVMNKGQWINKIYLTDDDITGIRKMGQRRNVDNTWPTFSVFEKIETLTEGSPKEIEFASLKEVMISENSVTFTMALLTHSPNTEIIVEQFSDSWSRLGTFKLNKIIETNKFNLKLGTLRPIEAKKVKLIIKTPNDIMTLEKEIPEE